MAWSRIQSAVTASSGSFISSTAVAYGTNLSSGTKLIAVTSTYNFNPGTYQIDSVKDGAGNSFTLCGRTQVTSSGIIFSDVAVWALDTPAAEVGTKPTITARMKNGLKAQIGILVQEVSGLIVGNTLAMLDGTAGVASGTGGSGSTGSPAYTSTASSEYLVSIYGDDGGPVTYTKPAALTADANNVNSSSNVNVAIAYGNSTNGVEAGSWALSGTAADWGTILVAFKLSSSSGGTTGGTGSLSWQAQPGAMTVAEPAFPSSPLDVRAEIELTSGTWTDITGYVYQRTSQNPISTTHGRPDESSQSDPAAMTYELNNRDGRFTVLNPNSPYYGQLNRNTPLRLSLPTTAYLRLEGDVSSYASATSTRALNLSGDLDVRIDLRLSSYEASTFIGKYNSGSTGPWLFGNNADGTVALDFVSGGTLHAVHSTQPIPLGRICLRATLQVNDGSGGHLTSFYTATSMSGPWTQLGNSVSGTGTTVLDSNISSLTVGYSPGAFTDFGSAAQGMNGKVYSAQLLNGIGGSVVAGPDFTAQKAGVSFFTDAYGNTWSMNGTAEISDRSYRFHGEMSSLPTQWDTTGTDVSTPVTAAGLLRRLGQGTSPIYSSMKRGILQQTGQFVPVAYWPCEDPSGATAISSGIGGTSMYVNGTAAFTGDTAFVCSAALPTINSSSWYGQVAPYSSNGCLVGRFLLDVTTALTLGANATIVQFLMTGTATSLEVYSGGSTVNNFGLRAFNASGGSVFDTGAFTFAGVTGVNWMSLELTPKSGGRITYALVQITPGAAQGTILVTGTFTGVIGNCIGVNVNPTGIAMSMGLGHIQVQSQVSSVYSLYQQLNAWNGELAGNRFERLCSENAFQSRIYGIQGQTAAMGYQTPQTLSTLLQECETADMGMIYEPRQALALGYRTLASLTNQAPKATLVYTQAVLGGTGQNPLAPTYDDQYTRNDITATRSSTATSSTDQSAQSGYRAALNDGSQMSISPPPVGVGDYASSYSANLQLDSQLPDVAWWKVHVGTVNTYRWPVIVVNMARLASRDPDLYLDLYTDLYGTDFLSQMEELEIGDYIQVADVPSWLPPESVNQIATAINEQMGGFYWVMSLSCVPEKTYETGVYDDPTYGRVDTSGSTLATAITDDGDIDDELGAGIDDESGAALDTEAISGGSISVASSGVIWTTVSSDWPFDINIDGERITVTAVSGSSSPQTFTVTRQVNGIAKTHSAGADVRLWTTPVYAVS